MPQSKSHPRLARLKKILTVERKESAGLRCSMWIGTLKKDGTRVAVIFRRAEHIYVGTFKSLNQAKDAGVLGWMLDAMTVKYLYDHHHVRLIITAVRETGDLWVSRIEDWLEPSCMFIPTIGAPKVYGADRFQLKLLPVSKQFESPGDIALERR